MGMKLISLRVRKQQKAAETVSYSLIWMITMKWAGHIEWKWKVRNTYRMLFGKPKGKVPAKEDLDVSENNIKIALEKQCVYWLDSSCAG